MAALRPDEELGLRATEMEEEEGMGRGEEQSLQLNLQGLDLTSDEFILDEVDIHIQANLEDSLVQEALKTGVDLRQYSKQVELELQHIEHASIRDYIKESKNITSLHNQITACDAILERMEQMLSSFQCDLSSISCEIQTLQEQSVAMNLRLKNRQAVRSQLSQLVDELVVPAAMISTILEAPVTEQDFLEQLHELNNKMNYVKEQAFRETMACTDVHHVLDRLKVKAVTKIREFVLQKIYSFRKPMTNYQIPQNALLKYRFFYQFLLGNERSVAQELREQYVETMSKIYLSYFKSYTSRLMKIQYEEVAEKDDLMGVEDTAKKDILAPCAWTAAFPHPAGQGKGWGGWLGRRRGEGPSLKNRNTIFTLGNRGSVIGGTELEGPIIVPHAAQKTDVRVSKGRYWDTLLEILWPRFEYILELNIQSIQNTDPQKLGFLDTRPHYEFIEEILSPPFGGMIAFVKESESLIEKGQLDRLRGEEVRVTQLVRGFSTTWKASVESLSQDGALTQLIQYYHRFHKVLAQPPLRALPARAELINIHHLMVELKKHKPNF
ncbi:Folylpolyglutamate synthase (bifunctional enzyme) [Platysternon megacephalum]|uniref:Vacuolar protein sorting-associated protein 52 homolog n=1 Tax=Platysternon megacephalum TaxID=55544 RepID=A0A4D9DLE8_9SAUR|nr:Folylpolyglutamate synthase (bifunctional enzyme) [Platysternon megacephalum]